MHCSLQHSSTIVVVNCLFNRKPCGSLLFEKEKNFEASSFLSPIWRLWRNPVRYKGFRFKIFCERLSSEMYHSIFVQRVIQFSKFFWWNMQLVFRVKRPNFREKKLISVNSLHLFTKNSRAKLRYSHFQSASILC